MRLATPRSLLVDHPALPDPFAPPEPHRSIVPVGNLNRIDRSRVAVQLLAVTALLSDFELWPGRWALRQARIEDTEDGLRVRLPGLPLPLSRIWSWLGGGDPATLASRSAILETIEETAGVDGIAALDRVSEPGFFFDRALAKLIENIGQPLDHATARSLWMWRWSLPRLPDPGDRTLIEVPDEETAKRIGSALWASAGRRGMAASLEFAVIGGNPVKVAARAGASGLQVCAGSFDDGCLAAMVDGMEGHEGAVVALGRFPEGWNPSPTPIFDPERLSIHLAISGLTQTRKLRVLEHLGAFDPFSPADRRALTRSARWLFSAPATKQRREFREILGIAGLSREGIPVDRALDLAGVEDAEIEAAIDAGAIHIRHGKVMLRQPQQMTVDPRHGDVIALYDREDPRRILHGALATGDPGMLLVWARERLDDLDGHSVRHLLSGVETGALGAGVQVALVEACLTLADVHGARKALEGLSEEIARPWSNWLQLMDRLPEAEIELPNPTNLRYAPRAAAEIALVKIRRGLKNSVENIEAPLDLVRRALPHLNGANRRWIEIRLAARVDPKRLDDRTWRRRVTRDHPELMGLVMFERFLRATFDGRRRLARSLLRRLMSVERAPGRLALMQLNMGYIEAEDGSLESAESHTVAAYRLFQAAGFRRRVWDALYNLAVADIDQLRVVRAGARLDELAETGDSLFVEVERTRLALAVGDLELFEGRLNRLPEIGLTSDEEIRAALCFLHGAFALLNGSVDAAEALLREGGGEGRSWLELAHAVRQTDKNNRGYSPDGWGVLRAADLLWRLRNNDIRDELDERAISRLELKDALAVALCRRLGGRPGWPGPRLRARAVGVLRDHGLTGWATGLRWRSCEVESLLRGLSRLLRNQGVGLPESADLVAIVRVLAVEGVVLRDARDGREILRIGKGDPGGGVRRGQIELVPLGGGDADGAAWDLMADLLEFICPAGGVNPSESDESLVRIDGTSPAAVRLRNEVRQAASPDFPVFIHGETGSGKEVVAREIHRLSGRNGELVSVNVAAIPDNLLEAELFGSKKGAFTGADRSRRGLVAAAEGGTLFLDEVGDLDVALQVKLLRFLESGEIRAVGADRTHCLDVRVICATHRNLDRRVREGRFRRDLFYRIVVSRVEIPNLVERREDIPVLRSIFEREIAAKHKLKIPRWTAAAERLLMSHRWPGNIRELKHTVEVAMARAGGETIKPVHLPLIDSKSTIDSTWESSLTEFKRRLLNEALGRHGGNRSATARELGISRQALLYQIKKLGLGGY